MCGMFTITQRKEEKGENVVQIVENHANWSRGDRISPPFKVAPSASCEYRNLLALYYCKSGVGIALGCVPIYKWDFILCNYELITEVSDMRARAPFCEDFASMNRRLKPSDYFSRCTFNCTGKVRELRFQCCFRRQLSAHEYGPQKPGTITSSSTII